MKASAGDWLIARARTDHQHTRRALVLEVRGREGAPPYLVRWLDDGHESIVFPGPDAVIVEASEQAARDETEAARLQRVQRELAPADHRG